MASSGRRRFINQLNFGGAMSTVSYDSSQPVPWNLVNFYESEAPWHPPIDPQTPSTIPNQPISTWGYRSTPLLSDAGTYPGDSGYGGSGPTLVESVPSIHEDDNTIDTTPMENLLTSFHVGQDILHGSGPVEAANSQPYKFFCQDCNTALKTKSEYNKHFQRHNKPHKCTYLNCTRSEEGHGFSTPNDLARHLRTVHKEHYQHGPVYICKHEPCINKKVKIWPRADNFRCHLSRTHNKDIRAEDDLRPYIYYPQQARRHELQGIGQGLASPIADIDSHCQPLHLQDSSPPRGSRVSVNASPSSLARLAQNDTPGQMNPPSSLPRSTVKSNTLPDVSDSLSDASQSEDEAASETDESPSSQDDAIMEDSPGTDSFGDASRGNGAWASGEEPSNRITRSETDLSITPSDSGLSSSEPNDSQAFNLISKTLMDARSDREKVLEVLKSLPKELLESVLHGGKASEKDEQSKTLHKCSECTKSFMRQCELKKHMKRHDKPYGCTFKNCDKFFGSKNDWKRHESSQHFMLEMWTCDVDTCQKVRHRRETFKNHLHKDHQMEDKPLEVEKKLEKCRMGRHCDPRFWCGFCNRIVEIREKGVNSWTKRCDHIDNHLFGKAGLPRMSMTEWQYQANDEENATPTDAEGAGEYAASSGIGQKRKAVNGVGASSNKRHLRDGKETTMWQCCRCSQMMTYTISAACVECTHARCTDCRVEKFSNNEEELAPQVMMDAP